MRTGDQGEFRGLLRSRARRVEVPAFRPQPRGGTLVQLTALGELLGCAGACSGEPSGFFGEFAGVFGGALELARAAHFRAGAQSLFPGLQAFAVGAEFGEPGLRGRQRGFCLLVRGFRGGQVLVDPPVLGLCGTRACGTTS